MPETKITDILDKVNDGVYYVNKDRKIEFWNKSASDITGFNDAETLGRKCCDDILIHVDENGNPKCNTEKCPLFNAIQSGKEYRDQLYLHHKDGHRVPVDIKVIPDRDKDGNIVGAIEIFSDKSSVDALQNMLKELKEQVLQDSLTEIGNRKFIELNLDSRIAEFKRINLPFGILFIDVDDFKFVNDKFGHNTGDKTLKMIAKTLNTNIRPYDMAGRWGGEEFVAIIVNVDNNKLFAIAEKLRILIEKSIMILGKEVITRTVSVGCTLCRNNDTVESIIKRADTLMYESKKNGKNKVTIG